MSDMSTRPKSMSESISNGETAPHGSSPTRIVRKTISRIVIDTIEEFLTSVKGFFHTAGNLTNVTPPLDVMIITEINDQSQLFENVVNHKMQLLDEIVTPIISPDFDIPIIIRASMQTMLQSATQPHPIGPPSISSFLSKMEDCTAKFINNTQAETDPNYSGLDYERDTVAQVRNILLKFPNSLMKLPYVFQCKNWRSVSFLPEIALIRTEVLPSESLLDEHGNDTRGGILAVVHRPPRRLMQFDFDGPRTERITLQCLIAMNSTSSDREENLIIEERVMHALHRLKQLGMIRRRDVYYYNLIRETYDVSTDYFSARRLKFLLKLNPVRFDVSFIRTVVTNSTLRNCKKLLRETVFHSPGRWPLYFIIRTPDDSPYEISIQKYGMECTTTAVYSALPCTPQSMRTRLIVTAILTAARTAACSSEQDVIVVNFICCFLLTTPAIINETNTRYALSHGRNDYSVNTLAHNKKSRVN